MSPTATRSLAAHRRAMKATGEIITLRRGSGATGDNIEVLARVVGYEPNELVGDVEQGDRKFIVLAENVTLDPPLSSADRIILRGEPLQIEAIDDSTRRVGGHLIAYEIRARGF